MKYAIVENGKVVNIASAESPLNENWIQADSPKIGDTWDGSAFTTPPIDPAVIAEAARITELDDTVQNDTTIGSLKAMTKSEFDAWWSANVTNAAQAIGVLKRLARIVIRRL